MSFSPPTSQDSDTSSSPPTSPASLEPAQPPLEIKSRTRWEANDVKTNREMWQSIQERADKGDEDAKAFVKCKPRLKLPIKYDPSKRLPSQLANVCVWHFGFGITVLQWSRIWQKHQITPDPPRTLMDIHMAQWVFRPWLREKLKYPMLRLDSLYSPNCPYVISLHTNRQGPKYMRGRDAELIRAVQDLLETDMPPLWHRDEL